MSRSYQLLGPLTITDAGRPSALLESPKGCALVAYLILQRAPQTRAVLADLLWEAASTGQALRNLRVLLTRLRPLTPELRITRTTLAYQPSAATTVDLLDFEAALTRSEADQTPEAAARLDEALQAYRGDLLADLSVPDAPQFEEWLVIERERLRRAAQTGYARLLDTYTAGGHWAAALTAARRWLRLDPLDEAAARAAMQALAATGHPAGGLAEYEALRLRLWNDLAVEPEAATQALAQGLRDRLAEASVLPEAATPTLPAPDELPEPGPLPPQAMLPFARNPDFTGRQAELRRLAEHLLPRHPAPTPPTAALTGMGGLGKTQLAVEFAYRYGRYFPGGVFWLRFADEDSVADEVAATGGERGLGLFRDTDQRSLADRAGRVQRAWQEPTPRLLIFDNCESEALLADWRPVTGGCRVLLTSRHADWPRELQVEAVPLTPTRRAESVALLQRPAPHLSPAVADQIAGELGDLPLALHLAGSFLARYRTITPESYLAQLRAAGPLAHPSLQGRGAAHSPTGHDLDVGRTFALSLARLDPAHPIEGVARQVLARAACLAPGEPIPVALLAAATPLDEPALVGGLLIEDAVARLVSLGLLTQAGDGALILHRLAAAFASDLIENAPEARAAVEAAVLALSEAPAQGAYGLVRLPFAPAHLRRVMEAARPRQDAASFRLLSLWARYLRDGGRFEPALPLLEQVHAGLARALGPTHPDAVNTVRDIGNLHVRRGRYRQAQPMLEQYLELQQRAEPAQPAGLAQALDNMGTLHMALGHYALAGDYLRQALALRQAHLGPTHVQTGGSLVNWGVWNLRTGRYAASLEAHTAALNILAPRLGPDHPSPAMVRMNQAHAHLALGQVDQAWAFASETLTLRERVLGAHHPQVAMDLNLLGIIALEQGRLEAAQDLHTRALAIREAALDAGHRDIGTSLNHLGRVLIKRGDLTAAAERLNRARTLMEQALGREHPRTAGVLVSLGELQQAQGNTSAARELYQAALNTLERQVEPTQRTRQRAQRCLASLPPTTTTAPRPLSKHRSL